MSNLRQSITVGLILLLAGLGMWSCDTSESPTNPDVSNGAPLVPELDAAGGCPAHESQGIANDAELSWICSDPDGDSLTYDVYFGERPDPSMVASGVVVCSFTPASLLSGHTYYWKVVAHDGNGHSIASPLWRFSVGGRPRVLVDASRDGGGWWFPQGPPDFDPQQYHQGTRLAEYIRNRGYEVDELPRGAEVTDSLLSQYRFVIVAGKYLPPDETELAAYDTFLERPVGVIYISEYLRPGRHDILAERLGIQFAGIAKGWVNQFAEHPVTDGATPFFYKAGSVLLNAEDPDIEVLAWLDADVYADMNDNDRHDAGEPYGAPVMGRLNHQSARVIFIGEINGLEGVPQPLTDNLITWVFDEIR